MSGLFGAHDVPLAFTELLCASALIWAVVLTPGLGADLRQLLTDGLVPGLSIGFVRDGEVIEPTTAGTRNASTGVPVDVHTIFEAASLSKPVFAYAVLQLVDAGTLSLDTPLARYVPDYVSDDPRAADVTVRNVLSQLVRDQRSVIVQGVKETWQLVWDGKPSTVCGPEEVNMAVTCPCSGFAYAEYGKLSLVRRRGDREVDRMDLRPLFGKSDYPEAEKVEGTAYLVRWPLESGDFDRENRGEPKLMADIKRRSAPIIMRFANYDRDREATEFLIQVGTLPCGKRQFAAIGVSAKTPHLHALTSVAKPDEPLIMPLGAWQALLNGPGPHTVPTWACGDHGSDVRIDLVVSAGAGQIHVKEREFSCPPDGQAGKLVKETAQ